MAHPINRSIPEVHLVHQGQYLSYYELHYRFPDGEKTYEMVSKTGSKHLNRTPLTAEMLGKNLVGIVLFVFNQDHSKILLGKEFRLSVNQYVYNNIAGLIDPGETAEQAAKRELFEETGLELTKILDVLPGSFSSAPVTDDVVTCLICEATGEVQDKSTNEEEIHAEWFDREQVMQLLYDQTTAWSGRMQAMAYAWAKQF